MHGAGAPAAWQPAQRGGHSEPSKHSKQCKRGSTRPRVGAARAAPSGQPPADQDPDRWRSNTPHARLHAPHSAQPSVPLPPPIGRACLPACLPVSHHQALPHGAQLPARLVLGCASHQLLERLAQDGCDVLVKVATSGQARHVAPTYGATDTATGPSCAATAARRTSTATARATCIAPTGSSRLRRCRGRLCG